MIERNHIDQAYIRLKELAEGTQYPVDSDEWWAMIGAEVNWDPDELAAVSQEIAPKQLERWPATRGLLIGLLAARYSVVQEPGEVL